MKSKLMIISVIIFLTPGICHAGKKEDLANEMIVLTNAGKMADQLKSRVMQIQSQMIEKSNLPDEHKKEASNFEKKIMDLIFSELSWDTMKDYYIKICTEVYSEEELKGIVEFYKSSIGQSMIKKQPILINKTLALTQAKMNDLLPRLEKMISEFENSLKAKETDTKGKNESTPEYGKPL